MKWGDWMPWSSFFECWVLSPFSLSKRRGSSRGSLVPLCFLPGASLIAQLLKNPPAMQEDLGLIPGSGRSSGEGIGYPLQYSWDSLVAQLVKNLPAMWETWVWSLGWEDPLSATHSSILAWRIPWTIQFQSQRIGHDWVTFTFTFTFGFCHKGDVICISEVIDISPSNLDSSLCFIKPGLSDRKSVV